MEKQILVVEKICNYCFNTFIINTKEEITDDGMIKDVRCPHCDSIVHVWLKINLLDVKIKKIIKE